MKRHIVSSIMASLVLICAVHVLNAQHNDPALGEDIKNILNERQRAEVMNTWLEWRLDNIIPELLRREGIDMWIIMNREYNEDPVYMSMVVEPVMYARRLSILIFHDSREGFKKLTANWHGQSTSGPMYENILTDRSKGVQSQFDAVAAYIEKNDPRKIGLDFSASWGFGDGLTVGLMNQLKNTVGSKYVDRFVSAENLCVGWLETRSPEEIVVYRHVSGVAHDIIAEFFSNRVVIPGVTTSDDVEWWIRDRITGLGIETWFPPSVRINRSPQDKEKYGEDDNVIRRGDLLHCDVGIVYLGLCTDTQRWAYVLRKDETDVPAGIKEALRKGNRVQDIFMSEYRAGDSGSAVVERSYRRTKAEGLDARIYTHPVGFYGHAAGTLLGYDFPVREAYPLHLNTCYAIELSNTCPIPEWNNASLTMGLEENAVFTTEGCRFIDGRMTEFYIIK